MSILPVHFDEYLLWIEQSEWYEWTGRDATLREEGGNYRRSKRYKTPVYGKVESLVDFGPILRQGWEGFPSAHLWTTCDDFK